MPRSRQRLLQLTALLIIVVVIEVLARVIIAVAPGDPIYSTQEILRIQTKGLEAMIADDPGAGTRFDGELGWTVRREFSSDMETINAQGHRSLHTYSSTVGDGVLRVAAYGDSFVFGSEVNDQNVWSHLLERDHPNIELLNYGVPGYGLDQAYLRYRRTRDRLGAQVVLIGMTPVTLERLVNVCSSFYAQSDFSVKPRFVVGADGALELIDNPIESFDDAKQYLAHPQRIVALGEHDYFYDPLVFENPLYDLSGAVRLATSLYHRIDLRFLDGDRPNVGFRGTTRFNVDSAPYHILTKLTERWVEEVRANGKTPLVVVFTDYFALQRQDAHGQNRYAPYVEFLEEKGYDFLDLADAFAAARGDQPIEAWFMSGFHYSPAGNVVAAKAIAERLETYRTK